MYVHPFWFGVLVTVIVELAILLGYGFVVVNRGKKKK